VAEKNKVADTCHHMNGFVPHSHGRRVWSLARTSLNVKVKGQGSRSSGTKRCYALASPPGSDGVERARCKRRDIAADGTILSLPGGDFGGLRAVHVW